MILNLADTFKPFEGEEINFESFTFNGGEPHIRILESEISDYVKVTHRINSFNDLGLLCIAIDALRRMQVKTIDVFIPYFPAARQDRIMVEGESLTVKVYANIINQLALNSIQIFDPHSSVAPALLDRCEVLDQSKFIKQILKDIPEELFFVSPDAGALKKVSTLAKKFKMYDVIECSKKRDLASGNITGFKVHGENLQGKSCLIIDDICDGGRTFTSVAKELKEKGAGAVYLAVSHGIFSRGYDLLSEHIDKIYTTDSIKEIDHPIVKQIPFNQILK